MRYPIPANVDTDQLQVILPLALRKPDGYVLENGTFAPPTQLEYQIELTPAELVTLDDIFTACQARANYGDLPDWVRTGTAAQAETYITAQILNGYTIAQAEAYVDATIKNITTANVSQINAQLANVRTVFKAVADALIVMRGLFIVTAKLLIYVRDLFWDKFRK